METQENNSKPSVILKEILTIYIPALVTMLSFLLLEVITTVFNGHLGTAKQIAGSGLGSMFTTIIGLALACGMNSTLTTLISQTWGQQNLHLCGVYLNRARVIVTLFFVPITIILLLSEQIFVHILGLDPEISHYA